MKVYGMNTKEEMNLLLNSAVAIKNLGIAFLKDI